MELNQQVIEDLIFPVTWSEFLEVYLGKKPLHISGNPESVEKLASPQQVRQLIETGTPWQFRRMPEIYLDGVRILHEDLVDFYVDMDGCQARAPKLERIRKLLEAGATVNSFGQESHFPGLAWLRKAFSRAFSAEVEVATFYSQKDHQGLAPHFDCVEIFVLQISGTKRWFVSSQCVESPVVGYGTATLYESKAPHAEIVLEPGDLLYFPRGTFHQAVAISEESLHVTIAVKIPTYLDMLLALAKTAPELDALRADLPIGGAEVWSQLSGQLIERLQDALNRPEFGAELQRLLKTRTCM